jgi:competence ComEA-like helix-hairpin-helix protein
MPSESISPREGIPLILNAGERRGALVVVLLLAIGTAYDLWRAQRTPPVAPGGARAAARDGTPPDGAGDARGGPARDQGTGAAAARPASDTAARGAPPERAVLDLNRAGAAELDALPGIGPVLARRIVEHRARHGPFRRVEELRAVRGVGPRLLNRLRPRLRVDETPGGS